MWLVQVGSYWRESQGDVLVIQAAKVSPSFVPPSLLSRHPLTLILSYAFRSGTCLFKSLLIDVIKMGDSTIRIYIGLAIAYEAYRHRAQRRDRYLYRMMNRHAEQLLLTESKERQLRGGSDKTRPGNK